jgi:hypothetical protein
MDLKTIEALLDKYYDGETTLEEEKNLKTFFRDHDVPEDIEEEKVKFLFYAQASEETIDVPDEKLLSRIARKKVIIPLVSNRYRIRMAGIAASILLIIGIACFMNRDLFYVKNTKPVASSNPQLANIETRNALLLVSEKLNIGNRNLSRISKWDEMQDLITKKNTTK